MFNLWDRTDIFTPCEDSKEPRIDQLTVDEIMNGIPGSDYKVSLRQVQSIPFTALHAEQLVWSSTAPYNTNITLSTIQSSLALELHNSATQISWIL